MANARNIEILNNLRGYHGNLNYAGSKFLTLFPSITLVGSLNAIIKSGGLSAFFSNLIKDNTLNATTPMHGIFMIFAIILLISRREENYDAEPFVSLLRNRDPNKKNNYYLFSSSKEVKEHHDDVSFSAIMTYMLILLETELLEKNQSFSYLETIVLIGMMLAFVNLIRTLCRGPEIKVTI